MWYLITRKGIVGGGGEISRDESVRKENRLTGYDLQESSGAMAGFLHTVTSDDKDTDSCPDYSMGTAKHSHHKQRKPMQASNIHE